jgi:hypothetical protein
MNCTRCGSSDLRGFNGEIAIHFPGLENVEKPIVSVFPKMTLCLGCGLVQFELPPEQLTQLKGGDFHRRTRAS